MRLRKIGMISALVAVMLMSFSSLAFAQEVEGEVDISGHGWLAARGTGEATLDMGGWIRVHIDGDVAITNLGDDFEVRILAATDETARTESVGPDVLLEGFEGWVGVHGTHFLIQMEGDLQFRAHGRGTAHLEGTGIYKTRYGRVHTWSNLGVDVAIDADTE